MAPPSFTKGKVALLDPFFSFFFPPEFAPEGERGSDARSVPRFGDVEGKNGEINLEEKERRRGDERATDGGKVRQSQIEPERKKVNCRKNFF